MIKSTVIDKPVEVVRIRAHNFFYTGQEDEGLILAYLHGVLNWFTDSVTCAKSRTFALINRQCRQINLGQSNIDFYARYI